MKRSTKFTKALAVLLCMVMVIGTFTIVPLTATAAEAPIGVGAWNGSSVTPWEEMLGSGTAEDPYLINSPADFIAMMNNELTWYLDNYDNNGDRATPHHFKITNDLNFAGKNIGNITVSFKDTWGNSLPVPIVLDGQGHTLYNITTTWGIIENLGANSEIKDINFVGYTSGRAGWTSGIAGSIAGNVLFQNVSMMDVNITNSSTNTNTGAFVANIMAGNVTLKNCSVAGSVNGGSRVGAFIGDMASGCRVSFTECVSGAKDGSSSVYSSSGYAGGFLGHVVGPTTFTDCVNYSTVSGSTGATRCGGFTGYVRSHSVTLNNCLNFGSVSAGRDKGDAIAAGFVTDGGNATISLTNCANFGAITATKGTAGAAGGLVGMGSGSGTLTMLNCFNAGAVAAKGGVPYCGGLVGDIHFTTAKLENVYNTGVVTIEHANDKRGALIGSKTSGALSADSYIKNAYSEEDVNTTKLHSLATVPTMTNCDFVKDGELADETTIIYNTVWYGVAIDVSKISLNIAEGSENLSIALRVKEPFGFSAATTVLFDGQKIDATDYIVGNDKLTFGFAFVPSVEPVTVDQILASDDMVFVEAEAHKDGNGKFISFYEELNVSNVDETVYFAAVILDARTGDVLIKSDARYLNPYSLVCQGAEGAILGNAVGENEQALYQAIVDYKVAYNGYLDSVGGKKN